MDLNLGFEGCGLEAKCENRGQRQWRQWRRRRRLVDSDAGFCSSVAGGADPGCGAERFSERFFWDSNQWIRIWVLKDVGWKPSVKTGASVPSFSGGVAV